MKAIRLRWPIGLATLEVVDIADPGQPGAGEIRVRVRASSLNFHDLGVVSGKAGAPDGRVPMSDGAGVVEAVGPGVTAFSVGDAVVSTFFPHWLDGAAIIGDFAGTPGDGIDGFAQDVVVRSAHAFTLAPKGWSHAEAATITTAGLTAWRALVADGGLKAGDTVLALGTGGVSIYALQIAKLMGAAVVITSSSDEKLARAKALGADHGVNYRTTEQWGEAARAWTGGRGVDHVIEVGGPGTLAQSMTAVRVGGHISMIGVLTGRSGEVPTGLLLARQARLQGLIVGSRRQQQDFVAALNLSDLRPVIDVSFALEDISKAFELQAAGKHFGKVVLEW
ncbi:MAG: zinc-dependent alcohol dehydrogenase family protein [Caulobacteraceae bacterium]